MTLGRLALGCAAVLVLAGSACGETSLLGEGDECVASSQCQEGLVCDLAVEPSVCRSQGSTAGQADAMTPVIDGGVTIDGAPPAIDAAPTTDAAPAPIDATPMM